MRKKGPQDELEVTCSCPHGSFSNDLICLYLCKRGCSHFYKKPYYPNCPVFIGMERLEELFLDSSESRESFQYGYISYKLPVNVFPFIQCRNENKPYSGTQAQDKSKMINQS